MSYLKRIKPATFDLFENGVVAYDGDARLVPSSLSSGHKRSRPETVQKKSNLTSTKLHSPGTVHSLNRKRPRGDIVTQQQQADEAKATAQQDKTSFSFVQVCMHCKQGWSAVNGKIKYLGSSYDTAKQAAKAYEKEAIKLRRPFSKLNFPKKAPVGYTPIQKLLRSTNTVGYRGVRKKGKKFEAQIRIDGKVTYIGTHDTSKEAAIAYDRVVLKANKSTTLLNFPDMVHNLEVEPKRNNQKRSSTGYRGIQKYGNAGKFAARFSIGGKRNIVGIFDTAIQAALAYDQAAIKAGKKKSTLNFPDGLPIKQESDIDDGTAFWV
jgi:hypothetical protein